jgi:beta-lactamase superfamily II metal-dependent hydrolase
MKGYFSLEAVYAKKGDSLILHYGAKDQPRWILIDGGHDGVYEDFLRPHLEELRLRWPQRLDVNGRLPLEMAMVSHADADHIQGILDLTQHMRTSDPGLPRAPVSIDKLWFNSFDDIIDNGTKQGAAVMQRLAQTATLDEPDDLPIPSAMRADPDVRAVVASTRQGRQLRDNANRLAIELNPEYGGGVVMRRDGQKSITKQGAGLEFQLLGPNGKLIEKYRKKWDKDLEDILKNDDASARAASFQDQSAFNLASIMVLAKRGGRTMLLTGDARGDHLIDGLEAEGLLDSEGKIQVDLFKLPHHGSDRNVKKETFQRITATHYVISANGEHHNPEPATLDMLVAGRAKTRRDAYTLYLTFPEEAYRNISEEAANAKKKLREQKEALEAIDSWIKTKKPAECTVVYRQTDRRSVVVDLGPEKVL